MNIEQEATNAVRTSIIRNPYLSAYVDENDKTPVWDGFVNVYIDKNPNHPKSSLFGRVPIQVKGKKVQNVLKNRIAFRVSKDDIETLLKRFQFSLVDSIEIFNLTEFFFFR